MYSVWSQNKSAGRQIITIFIVTLVGLSSGSFYSWPTEAVPLLIKSNMITLEQGSYFTIIAPLAGIISGPIFAILVERIGRKLTLIITAVLQLISWSLIAYGGSLEIFYVARVFSGVADAGCYTVMPVFIGEITTPQVRSTWGNFMNFLPYLGNLLPVVLVYYMGVDVSAYVFVVVPLVFLVGIVNIPETPFYLVMRDEYEAAMRSLRWFRSYNDVDEEYKQIVADLRRQLSETGTLKDLITIKSNRNAIGIGAFLRIAQESAGIAALLIYAPFIFHESGGISDTACTIIFTTLLTIGTFGGAIVMGLLGRRRSTVISCFGCGFALLIEAVYFYFKTQTTVYLGFLYLAPIIGLSIYVLFYSIGIGIMATLVLGELFSTSVKGKCLYIMYVVFSLCVCVSTKIFEEIMIHYGLHFAFSLFAINCFVSGLMSCFIVPHTEGKSFEEIQQNLKKMYRTI